MNRVTLRDMAHHLGLHITTVSKALRNHPKIAAETRARVLAYADKAGYTPDPFLTALSSYRASVRPAKFRAVLAWLHPHQPSDEGRMARFGGYADYLAGAEARAKALGYKIEQFWMSGGGRSGQKLGEILRARGIDGVAVAPQLSDCGELIEFPWEDFSAITIGFSLRRPQLHLVTTDHFRILLTMEQKLLQAGYTKIGCYLNAHENRRMEERARSALAAFGRNRLPTLDYQDAAAPDFLPWFKKHRLDAVITGEPNVVHWLAESGLRIPQEVGVAHYAINREETWLSGMHHNTWKVGEAAIDMLAGMLQRRERGIPGIPMRLMIEGSWLPNQTVAESGVETK